MILNKTLIFGKLSVFNISPPLHGIDPRISGKQSEYLTSMLTTHHGNRSLTFNFILSFKKVFGNIGEQTLSWIRRGRGTTGPLSYSYVLLFSTTMW